MHVLALIATHKPPTLAMGTPVFAEGVEDGYTPVMLSVPRACFTPAVLAEIEAGGAGGKIPFCSTTAIWLNSVTMPAHHMTGQFGELQIALTEISLPPQGEMLSLAPDGMSVAVLVAYRQSTDEILFAEGTDDYGDREHQILFAEDADPDGSLLRSAGIPEGYHEAKHLIGAYGDILIARRYIPLS